MMESRQQLCQSLENKINIRFIARATKGAEAQIYKLFTIHLATMGARGHDQNIGQEEGGTPENMNRLATRGATIRFCECISQK